MSERVRRVAENIKEVLGYMLERDEIKDPRIGFITLTEVDVSRDIRRAKIYYSVLGGAEERQQAQDGLSSARGFIRSELGKRLRLKYIPEIEFKFDQSVESSIKISKLIHKTRDKRHEDDK